MTLYCLEIAGLMGCSDEQLKHIARGAYLHDIGKIGIPDAILHKPGELTEEEVATMQTHARIGYDLVLRIAFLAPAAEIVLAHQERWDGSGYPQGLTGIEIPLGRQNFRSGGYAGCYDLGPALSKCCFLLGSERCDPMRIRTRV